MLSSSLRIFDYNPQTDLHRRRFASLNREWLERYFWVEDHDVRAFNDPEGTVLAKGGAILMAETEGDIVGTGSLFALEDGTFEIAKMAVTERFQGRGVGETLLLSLIARAGEMGGRQLFIVSNTSLERAIRLYRRHGFTDSAENRHAHYERGNITLEKSLTRRLDRKAAEG